MQVVIECPSCSDEIAVYVGYEPPDPSVGVSGGFYIDDELPTTCPQTQAQFTMDELERMRTAAIDKAKEIQRDA